MARGTPGWASILPAIALLAAACASTEVGMASVDQTTTSTTSATDPITTTSLAAITTTAEPWEPPEHQVTIDDGHFVDRSTGEVFIPRGVNYIILGRDSRRALDPRYFQPDQVDRDFGSLADAGYNTVRLFIDSCACTTLDSGLDPKALDVLAELLQLAADHELVLLLTSNDLPDGGGYGALANRDTDGVIFPGYRNTHYLTGSGHEAMAAYWSDLISGLVERRAHLEAVLGWSILNEQWLFSTEPPLSLNDGIANTATGPYDLSVPDEKVEMVVDNVRDLIRGVTNAIHAEDPHGLVTMGFFAPQFPNSTTIGGDWVVYTEAIVSESDLDFFDFHAYPASDIGVEAMAENFGVDDRKPVVMGETGAFLHDYESAEAAGIAVQEWVARSCAVGFDGWLYWAYFPVPLNALPFGDTTWSLTDDDGYLLSQLAPISQPDPCVQTLQDPNLARNAITTASRSLTDELPQAAVDGDPETQWGSGTDAPQWIELAFEEAVDIGLIRLRVAQFPAGRTVHDVSVTFADGTTSVIATLDGDTDPGQVLEVTPIPALRDVVKVMVSTRDSPSWVAWSEIEVRSP